MMRCQAMAAVACLPIATGLSACISACIEEQGSNADEAQGSTDSQDATGTIPHSFGIGYTIPGFAETMKPCGARLVKVPLVAWGLIEPTSPEGDTHLYYWDELDELVGEYEDAGFELQLVLKAASPWGAESFEEGTEQWRKSYPPKDDCWDDYAAFVRAVVERYDGDGTDDMPGLSRPILYYEIESEAQHAIFWDGTVEEYNRLLCTAYQATHEASEDVGIILSGINFGSYFSEEEFSSREKDANNEVTFILESLANADCYDIVDYHYNRGYDDAYMAVDAIRNYLASNGFEKEIWAGDAASVPWVTDDATVADILKNPEDPAYPETIRWLREEQAILTVKKLVVGMELGLGMVVIETFQDVPLDAYENAPSESWFVAGLLDEDGSPRPVFHAYRQLAQKVGSGAVERVDEEDVHLYRIVQDGSAVGYIGWCDEGSQDVEVEVGCEKVEVELVPTDIDAPDEIERSTVDVSSGVLHMELTRVPVYVSCIDPESFGSPSGEPRRG